MLSGPIPPPRHVAIIMDGNGRWASERRLPRPFGHRAGMKAVREAVEGAIDEENWNRPATEISALMDLLEEYIAKEVAELKGQGVRVHVLGDWSRLTPGGRAAVERVERETAGGQKLSLNLCISYSSRGEIARAARLLAEEVLKGTKKLEDIDEEAIRAKLYTAPWGDPDLLIRTSYDFGRRQGIEPLERTGWLAAAATPLLAYWGKAPAFLLGAVWLMVTMAIAMVRRGPAGRPLTSVSITLFGCVYASGMLAFLIAIRHGGAAATRPLAYVLLTLFPLVITWMCDTAAMAVGTAVGGPKLAPILSPKKTHAGAVGGTLAGVITALALGKFVLNRQGWSFSPGQLLLFGLAVSIVGQIGDVAESLFKREAGLKDSSTLIPGHGGVLDRLDSLYFVIPTAAGLYRMFGVI